MSMKSRILASVGGVGLTLAVAVTAITAGGPVGGSAAPLASPSSSPTALSTATTTAAVPGVAFSFGSFGLMANEAAFAAGDGPRGMGDPAQCEDVRSKLATNLGVTTEQLQEAVKKTILQEIDEAEQAGTITANQATAARDRVNAMTDFCANFGMGIAGRGGDRPAMGGGSRMIGSGTYQAVADYFGTTTEQLRQDAADLGTLQAIAAKYGKDNDAGKAGLKAAIEKSLKDDLTQRGVPQEMIDRIVSEFTTNFDTIYTSQLGGGMHFGPGGKGNGERRGPRTSPSPSPTSSTQ
jgi:hypothetical protein